MRLIIAIVILSLGCACRQRAAAVLPAEAPFEPMTAEALAPPLPPASFTVKVGTLDGYPFPEVEMARPKPPRVHYRACTRPRREGCVLGETSAQLFAIPGLLPGPYDIGLRGCPEEGPSGSDPEAGCAGWSWLAYDQPEPPEGHERHAELLGDQREEYQGLLVVARRMRDAAAAVRADLDLCQDPQVVATVKASVDFEHLEDLSSLTPQQITALFASVPPKKSDEDSWQKQEREVEAQIEKYLSIPIGLVGVGWFIFEIHDVIAWRKHLKEVRTFYWNGTELVGEPGDNVTAVTLRRRADGYLEIPPKVWKTLRGAKGPSSPLYFDDPDQRQVWVMDGKPKVINAFDTHSGITFDASRKIWRQNGHPVVFYRSSGNLVESSGRPKIHAGYSAAGGARKMLLDNFSRPSRHPLDPRGGGKVNEMLGGKARALKLFVSSVSVLFAVWHALDSFAFGELTAGSSGACGRLVRSARTLRDTAEEIQDHQHNLLKVKKGIADLLD